MSRSKKVLLVEDDLFTRFMMKEIIDILDIDVDVAENGEECCEALRANPGTYGVVLMDIHMPKMSGLDATRWIRERIEDPPRRLPIIAVTADDAYHNTASVDAHGMDGFIAKPVTPGELLGVIGQYCS